MTMHSKDFLAQELRAAKLEDMANRAATGYYHDYLSKLDFPEIQLAEDLAQAIEAATEEDKPAIQSLMRRHLNGEFDATKEESDAWAASPEGQETLGMLGSELRKLFE